MPRSINMLRDRRKEKLVGGLGMLPSREYLRKGLNLGEKGTK